MKKNVFGIWTKSFLYLDLQKKKNVKLSGVKCTCYIDSQNIFQECDNG